MSDKFRKHKPDDPWNCLCDECVYASLVRMGGPLTTVRMTKKKWFERRADGEETHG